MVWLGFAPCTLRESLQLVSGTFLLNLILIGQINPVEVRPRKVVIDMNAGTTRNIIQLIGQSLLSVFVEQSKQVLFVSLQVLPEHGTTKSGLHPSDD